MDSEHYIIPGYEESIAQAVELLRHEIAALEAMFDGLRSGAIGPAPFSLEHVRAMLLNRRTTLDALAARRGAPLPPSSSSRPKHPSPPRRR